MKQYDILIIGAGSGGIFSAFELIHRNPSLRVAVFETGKVLEKRRCPIDGKHVKECIHCPTCSIMQIVTATGQQGHNSGPARDTIAGQKLS